MNNIKVVFMGTPDFAVPVFEGLISTYNVALVVTQPDKPVGRKKELLPTPVKKVAFDNKIEVFQPDKIKEDFKKIIEVNPDLIITCAYGQIIPRELLELPRLGCLNVHASLLPKLRGGAPIHHALIDGYDKTGITIMYMSEKMDTGDIISQREYLIEESDNVSTLHDKLAKMGVDLLLETLPTVINSTNNRTIQNEEEATYGYNIKRAEERLNFKKEAREIYNQIRGLYEWPLSNMELNGEEIKVLECHYEIKKHEFKPSTIINVAKNSIAIACNDGIIYITRIKPFGKKEMQVSDYLNGIKKETLIGVEVK